MLSYIDINCVLSSIKLLHVDLLCLSCDVTMDLWRMWRECNGGSGGGCQGHVFIVIFMQFSAKNMPNNRLAPHGKSWIRH